MLVAKRETWTRDASLSLKGEKRWKNDRVLF